MDWRAGIGSDEAAARQPERPAKDLEGAGDRVSEKGECNKDNL